MGLIYSRHKIFHYREKLDSLPHDVDKIMPPVTIRIKPTNICNHDCWYCSYRVSNLQLGKDMVVRDSIPQEKMREITEDIISMGVKSVIFSGGGEPFVYPHLLETVKALAGSGVQFASLTNASRLKGEVAEVFAHHGTWLRVSIDGWDDESYAKYRDTGKHEFTKVIENMSNFAKLNGTCRLGISYIIDKDNYPHIHEFMARMKDIGVQSVKVSPVVVSDNAKENNDYHMKIFTEVKEQIHKCVDDLADGSFEIYDAYHELDEKFIKKYHWCPIIQILPVIGADCNVYACHDKAYVHDGGILGSIKDRRFKDFWFSDKNLFFKIKPSRDCNHHCEANIQNNHILDYLDADPEHLSFI